MGLLLPRPWSREIHRGERNINWLPPHVNKDISSKWKGSHFHACLFYFNTFCNIALDGNAGNADTGSVLHDSVLQGNVYTDNVWRDTVYNVCTEFDCSAECCPFRQSSSVSWLNLTSSPNPVQQRRTLTKQKYSKAQNPEISLSFIFSSYCIVHSKLRNVLQRAFAGNNLLTLTGW